MEEDILNDDYMFEDFDRFFSEPYTDDDNFMSSLRSLSSVMRDLGIQVSDFYTNSEEDNQNVNELIVSKVRRLKGNIESENNDIKYSYVGSINLTPSANELKKQIQDKDNKNKCFACVIAGKAAVIRVLNIKKINSIEKCDVILCCDFDDTRVIGSSKVSGEFIELEEELTLYFNNIFDRIESIKNSYYFFSEYDLKIAELGVFDVLSRLIKWNNLNSEYRIELGKYFDSAIINVNSLMNKYNKYFFRNGLLWSVKDDAVLEVCENKIKKTTDKLHNINDKIYSIVSKIETMDKLYDLVGSSYSKQTELILTLDLKLKIRKYMDEAELVASTIHSLNYYKELVQDETNLVLNRFLLSKIG